MKRWGTIINALLIAMLLTVGVPVRAEADAGDGLRSGSFRLSPSVTTSVGFNSNLFFLDSGETQGQGQVPTAALVRFVPRVTMGTASPETVDLQFDFRPAWTQFFGERDAVGQQSGLSVLASGAATFNPQGAVSFNVHDVLNYLNQPPNSISNLSINRLQNQLGARLGFHPGGRVLQLFLNYDWVVFRHLELFDDTTVDLSSIDRDLHTFLLESFYKFLPNTAFFASADFRLIGYEERTRSAGVPQGAALVNVDSTPLRLLGGLRGSITRRISAELSAGYGWSFHEQGNSFDGILANVQLAYQLGGGGSRDRVFIGYNRQFIDSTIGNFITFHRFLAGYQQGLFQDVLKLNIDAGFSIRDYDPPTVGEVTVGNRRFDLPSELSDQLLTVNAGVNYNATRWLTLGLGYSFLANFTDNRYEVVDIGTDPSVDNVTVIREFNRHLFTANVTARY